MVVLSKEGKLTQERVTRLSRFHNAIDIVGIYKNGRQQANTNKTGVTIKTAKKPSFVSKGHAAGHHTSTRRSPGTTPRTISARPLRRIHHPSSPRRASAI